MGILASVPQLIALTCQEMLRFNPNDNQGARRPLLDCLPFMGGVGDAAELISKHDEDGSAAWTWSRAAGHFVAGRDCTEAREALVRARYENIVPPWLFLTRSASAEGPSRQIVATDRRATDHAADGHHGRRYDPERVNSKKQRERP